MNNLTDLKLSVKQRFRENLHCTSLSVETQIFFEELADWAVDYTIYMLPYLKMEYKGKHE